MRCLVSSVGTAGAMVLRMRPEDELRELVADLKAVLLEDMARGHLAEDPHAPLPTAIFAATDDAPLEETEHQGGESASAVAAAPTMGSKWSAVAKQARAEHDRVRTLPEIRADLGDCTRCGLCETRRQLIFGTGAADADLVIIGEAPSPEEDHHGEPFVGAGGDMLNKMLLHVLGLEREEVFITNIVKCSPPPERGPHPSEAREFLPFLEAQLEAIDPKVILLVGRAALQVLFNTRAGMKQSRGQWRDWRGVPTMATFHPSHLQRQPGDKKWTFEDLKLVLRRYEELGGRRSRPAPRF